MTSAKSSPTDQSLQGTIFRCLRQERDDARDENEQLRKANAEARRLMDQGDYASAYSVLDVSQLSA